MIDPLGLEVGAYSVASSMRIARHGGIPDNATPAVMEAIVLAGKSLLNFINEQTITGSIEGHVILGGGLNGVTCCDGCRKKLHIYGKICLGAAAGGSATASISSKGTKRACSAPPKYLGGAELGGAYFGGVDTGVAVDASGKQGASASLGGGPAKPIFGIMIKATACFYFKLATVDLKTKCN